MEYQVPVLYAVAGLLVGAGLVRLISGGARRRLEGELAGAEARATRAEQQLREQSRMLARIRTDKGTVASLALTLPSIVQALNRGDLEPRRVFPLIVNLAEAIFQPGQILVYRTRKPVGGAGAERELHLVYHQGVAEISRNLKRVDFGDGKIGWAAQHRIDMLKDDWLNPARTEGQRIRDNDPQLRPDLIGPLVHHSLEGEEVLGVICLGGLGIRPRDEKLMFQLVTNLASLALVNSEHVKRLRERANTDGLTGLLNKRFFMEEHLARMIVAAEREVQPLALFIFDIDHFKVYNDTNGHPAGDELLRSMSALVRESLRPDDAVCRFGGEEFVVAMPDTALDHALETAERIRAMIAAHVFPFEERQPGGDVTISGGVAVFPNHGTSVAELVSHADLALYESKRRGRNRVTRYRGVEIGDADDATGFDLVPTADESGPA